MSYDVIVVGGSYAGLSATMQLARARRRVLIVDAGQPRNRFAHEAHGFLGQDGRAPHEIIAEAVEQLRAYPTVDILAGEAVSARMEETRFGVTLTDGRVIEAVRLILATGLRDEFLPIPGLAERWGVTVLHCPYCHGYEVADRALGVLANHPMAIHQALLIAEWGPTTYFTQGIYEPTEDEAVQFAERGIGIESTPIVGLLGDAPELEAVELSDGRVVSLGAIFTGFALGMASPLAEQLGCAFDDGPFGAVIRVDEMKQTTVPGVYAAGDATSFMHNATLASASGAMAGVAAHRSLMMEREHSLAFQRVNQPRSVWQ